MLLIQGPHLENYCNKVVYNINFIYLAFNEHLVTAMCNASYVRLLSLCSQTLRNAEKTEANTQTSTKVSL